MRKIIFTILMTATAFTFAGQFDNTTTASILEVPLSSLPQEILPSKQGFYYVRFAAAESDFAHAGSVLPGLGIGYRRFTGSGAADISISGIGHAERKGGRILWTAPKASFIHYFQPDAKKSAYVGGGLAWGGIDSRKQRYIGLIPSVVAGYEFIRKSVVLSFLELTLSQPALSVYRTEEFPGPIVEFSTGIGF